MRLLNLRRLPQGLHNVVLQTTGDYGVRLQIVLTNQDCKLQRLLVITGQAYEITPILRTPRNELPA